MGEEVKLNLDSATTLTLYKHLGYLYAIHASVGVRSGETSLIVGREDEIIKTDSSRARIIKELLSQGFSTEFWDALTENDPNLITKLSYARIHTERETALAEFSRNLSQQMDENYWQDFFERNTWIFGYGLNYQFLRLVSPQANVGGVDLNSRGAQIPDYLGATEANVKFTVLVEIKKPDTSLFQHSPYRPSVPMLGRDLVGGVAQLQASCREWEVHGYQTDQNREQIPEHTYTFQPKGILVIGQLNAFDELSKKRTLELYRRNLTNPEIITFDELFARAEFILTKN